MISEKDFEFTQMEVELLYWIQFYALKTEAETGDNIGFFHHYLRVMRKIGKRMNKLKN